MGYFEEIGTEKNFYWSKAASCEQVIRKPVTALSIGNETAPIQLAQCRFPMYRLAIYKG